jgi:hypothetical protein
MTNLMDHPVLVSLLSFLLLSFSARLGKSLSKRQQILEGPAREDFGVVLAATLTLLAPFRWP